MTDEALRIALPLIESFDGFRSAPYLCSAGVPTIGFGSTRYADGRRVTMLDSPISQEQARELLKLTVERDYLPAVIRLCPGLDTPRLEQRGSVVLYGAGHLRDSMYCHPGALGRIDRIVVRGRHDPSLQG